jgi:hypothetical protein
VRDQAERLGLPTAAKRESMDICFVGAEGTQAWLDKRYGVRSGPLLDAAGTRLGQHAGVTGFTVGQRQGLGLQPRGPQAEPRSKRRVASGRSSTGRRHHQPSPWPRRTRQRKRWSGPWLTSPAAAGAPRDRRCPSTTPWPALRRCWPT